VQARDVPVVTFSFRVLETLDLRVRDQHDHHPALVTQRGQAFQKLAPLRERRERIIPLFLSMLRQETERFKRPPPSPPCTLLLQLLGYSWLGNVRELRSAAKRCVLGLPPLCGPAMPDEGVEIGLKGRLQQIEKTLIEESLQRNEHNVDRVAVELGVAKRTLYYRMKQLHILLD
jgi:transcriptional regulator with PAS, ATPase and Fis domain